MDADLKKALAVCNDNKSELARRLGVTFQTVFNWSQGRDLSEFARLKLEKFLREQKAA